MSEQYPQTVTDRFGVRWRRRDDLDQPGYYFPGDGPVYENDRLYANRLRYSSVKLKLAGQ